MGLAQLNQRGRWDSEYYAPEYLELESKVSALPSTRLGDLAHVLGSAFYPAAVESYSETGLPFIRCSDVINHPVVLPEQPIQRIPERFVFENPSIRTLRAEDIIITKVGTPCYAGLVSSSLGECALSRTVLGLTRLRTDLVDPYYLVAYLRSPIGFLQLYREREQQIQLQLTLPRVRDVKIVLPSLGEQMRIRELMESYFQKLKVAYQRYQEAASYLPKLSEIRAKPGSKLSYVVQFRRTTGLERMDAEFFDPDFDEIEATLRERYSAKPISDLPSMNVVQGQYCSNYVDKVEGRPYIRGTDIENGSVSLTEAVFISPKDQNAGKTAREGDVVVTRVGSIGLVARIPKECDGGTVSDNLLRVRMTNKQIDSYYLLRYLDSEIGKLLMVRYSRGSVQQRLNKETLMDVPVPLQPTTTQKRVSELVQESQRLREEAESQFELAKAQVSRLVDHEATETLKTRPTFG